MARGDDLVLRVSADTSAVAAGLKPMTNALDTLSHNAEEAEADLKQLARTDVTLSVKDQALKTARDRIDELRDQIARDVVLGVDTKAAQREISNLESAVRRLADKPETVEVDVEVDKEAMADALEGVDSLREGALGLGEAVGAMNGTLTGFADIARETVPALADLNQTMVAMRLRNEAAGTSFGRLGRSVSAVTGVMAGPWGLAIAAGVGLLSGWAASQEDATDATDNFTDSINYQTGALDRANREAAAKALADAHLLDTAEALGISTQDMVSALAGEREAYNRVTDAIGEKMLRSQADRTMSESAKANIDEFGHSFFGLTVKMFGARDESGQLQRAIGEMADTTDGARFVVGNLSGVLTHNADLWADYGDQVEEARKEVDDIISSLDILNGRFASAREATIGYEAALDDASKAVEENGRAVTAHGKAFDSNSAKGRANEKALIDLAKASEGMTEARLRDADKSGESTAKILADYQKQRTSLIDTARKMGLSQEAAEDYVDSLLATPDELKTQVELTGYDKAEKDMKNLTKERDAVVHIKLNVDKFNALPKRLRDAISGNGSIDVGLTSVVPGTPPAPAVTPVFMSPRIYLDSRPIRAALRHDVTTEVSTAMATATTPRRTR